MKDVRDLLKTQFPPMTKDITDDEMLDVMGDVLRLQTTTDGKLPLTLVVLDEMQQYIGDDNDKAIAVQNYRGGLLVAVREPGTLRRDRPERPDGDAHASEAHGPVHGAGAAVGQGRRDRRSRGSAAQEAGARPRAEGCPRCGELAEIDRQLGGTQHRAEGGGQAKPRPRLPAAADSRPLLGTGAASASTEPARPACYAPSCGSSTSGGARRRPSQSGTSSAPTSSTTSRHAGMLQSGVLLKEIDELIRGLRTEGQDGDLKARICALVFLISQIADAHLEWRDWASCHRSVPRRPPRRGSR